MLPSDNAFFFTKEKMKEKDATEKWLGCGPSTGDGKTCIFTPVCRMSVVGVRI
jgi:hypothetical protein